MAGEVRERVRLTAHLSGGTRPTRGRFVAWWKRVRRVEASVRAPFGGGTVAVAADQAEPDELDIPAFLRRGN